MSAAPASPAPPSSVSTSPASPRPSGLRGGLSFLRNYTHSLQQHAGLPTGHEPRSPSSETSSSGRPRAATTSTPPPLSPAAAASTERSPLPAVPTTAVRPNTLTRTHTAPSSPQSPSSDSLQPLATMTRTRTETATPQLSVRNMSGPTPAASTVTSTPASEERTERTNSDLNKHLPSIRFICHQDPRAARPSLQFATVQRTLPDENQIIRVGRYSERDNIPEVPANVPSAAAVGFKSKVVSRKHCELWCKDGNWYIKDVKSSSGTFLNHIRLSQPNVESKPFRLKDGDIIQLGIDFRGGEEMIFRCVKIRIECNRGWQQALNTFNKQTHQRLRNLGKARKEGDNASTHASECSICLMSIAPCQSLFVAPCSHVWHYKCIRPILNAPTWPNFLCPNCRAVADLEADVEDMGEFETWDDSAAPANGEDGEATQDRHVTPKASTNALADTANSRIDMSDLEAAISTINIAESLNTIASLPVNNPATPQRTPVPTPSSSSSITQPVAINVQSANEASGLSPLFQHSHDNLGADRAPDCPMTPRNDAGPFVLDGSAGRAAGQRVRDALDERPAAGTTTSAPILPPVRLD